MKSHDIIRALNEIAPPHLAEAWDNVGLQVGSLNKEVKIVLLCLDLTEGVLQEAVEKQADMVIAHHPYIFNGIKAIRTDEPRGRVIAGLIKHDITLFVAHTNLDKTEFGLNDYIADKLLVADTLPLVPDADEKLYKLVVYVPVDYTDDIIRVMGDYGAGFIGDYSHCTFRTVGQGTFKPLAGTNPFIGSEGELAVVEENRVETIVKQEVLTELIAALKKVHPYEEMAYDLYPLAAAEMLKGSGTGRIGSLTEPMSPEAFIDLIKKALNIDYVRTAGEPPAEIKRVALCTGSGAEFIGLAAAKSSDVYVTGDLKYHDAQAAAENNLWVIDAGHYGTEKMVVNLLEHALQEKLGDADVTLIKSVQNQDFLRIV